MSETQMLFLFCMFYSGAVSLVIWANLVSRARQEASLESEQFAKLAANFKKNA
jgi:hypothetical protein